MKTVYFAFVALGLFTTLSLQKSIAGTDSQIANRKSSSIKTPSVEHYTRHSISFEENRGQADEQVRFLSRGSGYTLFLTPNEMLLRLSKTKKIQTTKDSQPIQSANLFSSVRQADISITFVDPTEQIRLSGVNQLGGTTNYFIGNDPKEWHRNIPSYAEVKYSSVFPDIDLFFHGNQRQLEYDFVVEVGGDPARISFDVQGVKRIAVGENGDLILKTSVGEVRWCKPTAYQMTRNQSKRHIEGRYVVKQNRVGFVTGKYDHRLPLVIDPVLRYSTYLGGSGSDQSNAIAVDADGNAYVTGLTNSVDFPLAQPFQSNLNGTSDAYVTKFDSSGSLVYSTYLGGSGDEGATSIAVDSSDNVYIAGYTDSNDFPIQNALQPIYGGGTDGFLAKLNSTGTALMYSTFLGGSDIDQVNGITVDQLGNAFVVGATKSTDYPVTEGAFQTICNEGKSCDLGDAFVSAIRADGSDFIYSTYLGGNSVDFGQGIALDSDDNTYITGWTRSRDFPLVNAAQGTYGGGLSDAFISILNPAGSALTFSTYVGGSDEDYGNAIAVDNEGNSYMVGASTSKYRFDLCGRKPNADSEIAIVTKIKAGGGFGYCLMLGATGFTYGQGAATDKLGNLYVTGATTAGKFPHTHNAIQKQYAGGTSDAFLTVYNSSGLITYSSFLGGAGGDWGYGVAVDEYGSAYVTGITNSTNFPIKNAVQPTFGGGTWDSFATKILFRSASK